MEHITVAIHRLPGTDDVPLPTYQTAHAAAMDLAAAVTDELLVGPGEIVVVPCGFSMAVPAGYEAQVRPRSGLALRHGIGMVNTPGTIDSDYRGEVSVLLVNLGSEPFVVEPLARIAQLVICPVARVDVELAAELTSTGRGDGGFGSTGA